MALYFIHDDIYRGALERVRQALTVCHGLEVASVDLRHQMRTYIMEFESLRAHLEFVGQFAANLRLRLIQENGCDATCEMRGK